MENALMKADTQRDLGKIDLPNFTRPLNPEDIELARKRAELSLYQEKAASLERAFRALREGLVSFSKDFSAQARPSDIGAKKGKPVGQGQTGRNSAIVKTIREELDSAAMKTLLQEDILLNPEIPHAAFTLDAGASRGRFTESPAGGVGGDVGAELIRVIRKIYAARERVLFLQRGIMKLQFSMLYQLMTEVQKADENGIDLFRSLAGSL